MEQKKAQLVVIAHDVDPIEVCSFWTVWLIFNKTFSMMLFIWISSPEAVLLNGQLHEEPWLWDFSLTFFFYWGWLIFSYSLNIFFQLVLFLPALCRKMGVPYCIVKGKARLGKFPNQNSIQRLNLYSWWFN